MDSGDEEMVGDEDDDEEEVDDEEEADDEEEVDDEEEKDDEEEDVLKTKNPKVKLAPLPEEYNNKKHCRINRLKKQVLNSSLVKDLKKEYSEAPDEYIETQEILGFFLFLNLIFVNFYF